MDRRPRASQFEAFGLRWDSDSVLEQFLPAADLGEPDVVIRRVDSLGERRDGRPLNNGEIFEDGARFRFDDAIFDIVRGESVRWSAPDAGAVPMAFYGTVAAIVLAWRGMVPLHGSAVELGGGAVMIAGNPGAGKSTMCDALIRHGCRLVSDDLSVLLPLDPGGRPELIPGRPAIRLVADGANDPRQKRLQLAPMVPPQRSVPFVAMVVLRRQPVDHGSVESTVLLAEQLFRPKWMRSLPFHRQRLASLLEAAPKLTIISEPGATDRPDIAIDDKAARILERLDGHGIRP